MIVNPVFCKSGKVLNSILKNQSEKTIKIVAKCFKRNPNFKLSKRRKIFLTCSKKPAKLNNLSLYSENNNFRWSKNSIKIILIYIFSGLNLLKTWLWLNQETKILIYNLTVLPGNDR